MVEHAPHHPTAITKGYFNTSYIINILSHYYYHVIIFCNITQSLYLQTYPRKLYTASCTLLFMLLKNKTEVTFKAVYVDVSVIKACLHVPND